MAEFDAYALLESQFLPDLVKELLSIILGVYICLTIPLETRQMVIGRSRPRDMMARLNSRPMFLGSSRTRPMTMTWLKTRPLARSRHVRIWLRMMKWICWLNARIYVDSEH